MNASIKIKLGLLKQFHTLFARRRGGENILETLLSDGRDDSVNGWANVKNPTPFKIFKATLKSSYSLQRLQAKAYWR